MSNNYALCFNRIDFAVILFYIELPQKSTQLNIKVGHVMVGVNLHCLFFVPHSPIIFNGASEFFTIFIIRESTKKDLMKTTILAEIFQTNCSFSVK